MPPRASGRSAAAAAANALRTIVAAVAAVATSTPIITIVSAVLAVVLLIMAGGLVYSLGAVAYATKKPQLSPTWFGFHEVFHACTIIAALLHAVAIGLAVFATA